MIKKIMFTLMFVFLMFSCLAENNFEEIVEASLKEVEGKALPNPLGILFGDEQINFHIKMNNGEELVLGLITVDKKVKSISLDEVPKPTLNVYSDEATIKEIQEAENTFLVLEKAMDEKRVTYKAVGLLNKIKFAFLSIFSNIVALFVDEGAEVNEQVTSDVVAKFEGENEEDIGNEITEEASGSNQITGSGTINLEEEEETDLEEEVVEEIVEDGPETHTVLMDNSGFNPTELTIKAGEKVIWENTRTGSINKAMVLGTRNCVRIKSKLFGPGESFSWTFDEAGKCTFVDGIMTTVESKVTIEE